MSEAFNPVIEALSRLLRERNLTAKSFSFVRVNSLALERLQFPEHRPDIAGGAFIDKMVHDVHLLVAGVLSQGKEVRFGRLRVHDLENDVQYAGGKLTLRQLSGRVLDQMHDSSMTAEMFADLSIDLEIDGQRVDSRWIASWCGVPPDLAARLGLSEDEIRAATLISPARRGGRKEW